MTMQRRMDEMITLITICPHEIDTFLDLQHDMVNVPKQWFVIKHVTYGENISLKLMTLSYKYHNPVPGTVYCFILCKRDI